MKPIPQASIPLKSVIRYIVPRSRVKLSQATFERLKASLIAEKSVILKDDIGDLYILSEKGLNTPYPSKVQVLPECLLQESVEKIAAKLNGGQFAHAYYNSGMNDIPAEHYIEAYGEKAFIAIKQNIGKRISYSWNYIKK
jgi:hypothetical protein